MSYRYNSSGGAGLGCLLFIIVAVVIIGALFFYVVIPVSLFTLVVLAIAGTVSGIGVAGRNMAKVLIEAHKAIR